MVLARYTHKKKLTKQSNRLPLIENMTKYLGKIGNVFHTKDIEAAIEKGKLYDPEITPANPFAADFGISMGIDPGYGSSSFGIVITQLVDAQLQVLYANEFQRPDLNDMLNVVMELVNKHQYRKYS